MDNYNNFMNFPCLKSNFGGVILDSGKYSIFVDRSCVGGVRMVGSRSILWRTGEVTVLPC